MSNFWFASQQCLTWKQIYWVLSELPVGLICIKKEVIEGVWNISLCAVVSGQSLHDMTKANQEKTTDGLVQYHKTSLVWKSPKSSECVVLGVKINGMLCYETLRQNYGIRDMLLSGAFSHCGKLLLLCLGEMASGRNAHCNLMLRPASSPSFPLSPSLFFHARFSARRWVLRSRLVSANIFPVDSDITRRSNDRRRPSKHSCWHIGF